MSEGLLNTPGHPVTSTVLLDAIPTPVFVKDRAGHFLAVNLAYEEITGLRRHDVVGRTVYDLYPSDLANRYTDADEALYAAGPTQTYEVPLALPSGERRALLVCKHVFADAHGAIAGFIGTFTDVTDQRHAERSLREANERLEARIHERTLALARANALLTSTLEATADGILAVDAERRVVAYNGRFLALWGIDPAFARTADDYGLLQVVLGQVRDPDAFLRRIGELYSGSAEHSDNDIELRDGRVFARHSLPLTIGLEPPGRVWSFRDITHEKQLELEMRHAQKMEAVGRLAGGVAHDFNNLLTVILANASLVAEALDEDHPALPDVSEIHTAAARAADLTRQLLAFSRKQIVTAKPVDLNAVLGDMHRMLTRLLGEDITVALHCAPDLWPISADPGQVEQIIANLCVNGRDAMSVGGTLTLTTRNLPARESDDDAPQGSVELSVRDTGAGMSAELRQRIFEPFFTTKEVGKGTGLGLSTVFGIVTQSGGTIDVQSVPGEGSTFRLSFPRADGAVVLSVGPRASRRAPVANATLLLVEDEPALRRVVARQLRAAGYVVVEAGDGREAEQIAARHALPFDLLLTDVVMPHMLGGALAASLSASGKARRVLFMSGFATELDGLPDDARVVAKPFQTEALLDRVHEVLAEKPHR